MKYQRLTTIALCTLIAVRGAAGEGAQPTEPAAAPTTPTRVRLTMTDGSRLKAELVRVEEGRFVVRTMARIPEERSIALTEVKRAELSRGQRRNARKGSLWGMGIGILPSLALTLLACGESGCSAADGTATVTLLTLGFAGLGAGIGSLVKTERWAEAPVSSVRVSSAEEALSPSPGALLRVTAPNLGSKRLVGTLVETTDHELLLDVPGSDRTAVPRTAISRVEKSERGDSALTGLKIGVLVGAVAGGIIAAASKEDGYGYDYGYVVGFALFGAGGGAGIGALIESNRWSDLPISNLRVTSASVKADNTLPQVSPDRQMRFTITPTLDRGVQARFSISWR